MKFDKIAKLLYLGAFSIIQFQTVLLLVFLSGAHAKATKCGPSDKQNVPWPARRIITAEQSPFHNPVSACGAGDAGEIESNSILDPSGDTQRKVDR